MPSRLNLTRLKHQAHLAGVWIRRTDLPLGPLHLKQLDVKVASSGNKAMAPMAYNGSVFPCFSSGRCFLWLRAKGTSKLWEVGHRSSIFLPSASGLWFFMGFHFAQCPAQPVKMSIATMWALAWPCFPVLEVETSTHLTGDLGRCYKTNTLGLKMALTCVKFKPYDLTCPETIDGYQLTHDEAELYSTVLVQSRFWPNRRQVFSGRLSSMSLNTQGVEG